MTKPPWLVYDLTMDESDKNVFQMITKFLSSFSDNAQYLVIHNLSNWKIVRFDLN